MVIILSTKLYSYHFTCHSTLCNLLLKKKSTLQNCLHTARIITRTVPSNFCCCYGAHVMRFQSRLRSLLYNLWLEPMWDYDAKRTKIIWRCPLTLGLGGGGGGGGGGGVCSWLAHHDVIGSDQAKKCEVQCGFSYAFFLNQLD